MTVALLDYRAEDAEVLTVAWLAPLRPVGADYPPLQPLSGQPANPLPFTLVIQVGGTESVDLGTADPVVQVDTLCDRSLGKAAAKREAELTHRRMLELGRWLDTITLTDGRQVSVDYLNVFKVPTWEDYEDTEILRKTGRYTIGLSYIRAPYSGT